MRRRVKTGGGRSASRGPTKVTRKRSRPTARRRNSVLSAGDGELRRQLEEAHQQQAATAEVLKVISRSTFDLQIVLDTLTESAARLCEADMACLVRPQDNHFLFAANYRFPQQFVDLVTAMPVSAGRGTLAGRVFAEGRAVHISDAQNDPDYTFSDGQRASGFRSMLGVPLLRDGTTVGLFILTRKRVRPFTEKQIELAETFADQAVIAIETVRLFETEQQRTRELSESLEQQTATSEVLKVISASPGELEPVFQAMLENATRLCQAKFGTMYFREGDSFRAVAMHGAPTAYRKSRLHALVHPGPGNTFGHILKTKQALQVRDAAADQGYTDRDPTRVSAVELGGIRTLLSVPMLKSNDVIGAIAIYRQVVAPFTEKQVALVTGFASQAVIAIENARLLNELRQRTDDLTEALDQQTATSEVLRIIATSPQSVQPVFDAIVANAADLCEATLSAAAQFDGQLLHLVAVNKMSPEETAAYHSIFPRRPNRSFIMGRAFVDGKPVHVEDIETDPDYDKHTLSVLKAAAPYRTYLGIPILRDGVPIGAIGCGRREVRPFTEGQIALVENFAAQAVIAIENTRLLNELRESLERQTATADVLKVISRSAFDLRVVLDTLLRSAGRLCEADMGVIARRQDDQFYRTVAYGLPGDLGALIDNQPVELSRSSGSGRALREGKVIHIPDIESDPEYTYPARGMGAFRTLLGVPMLRDSVPVGVMTLMRRSVLPFTDKQIELVSTFADQAAIAIENVRLFEAEQQRTRELSESLEQQTATSEVLRVISSSPTNVQPVLVAIVRTAVSLCNSYDAVILLREGERLRVAAHHGPMALDFEQLPLGRDFVSGRTVIDGVPVHLPDFMAAGAEFPRGREVAKRLKQRTVLGLPLRRESQTIGCLFLRRTEVLPFTDKQIELLTTFADQAVIAIENVRLFEAERQRTQELTEALEQQTATSEVLRVISSSPGDLEPVFNAMLAKATELCGASYGALWLRVDDGFRYAALHGDLPQVWTDHLRSGTVIRVRPEVPLARLMQTLRPVTIRDMQTDPSYLNGDPLPVSGVDIGGIRTLVLVPMIKNSDLVGTIAIYRKEVRPFTEKQIELLSNFAAQAVIAIENARLLSELRESLQQQTATADVLKVISRSTFDLQAVLNTLVESAAKLCAADKAQIIRPRNDQYGYYAAASYGYTSEYSEYVETLTFRPGREGIVGRVLLEGRPVQIDDVLADPEYRLLETQRLGGFRTHLGLPLLREDKNIGILIVSRVTVQPFDQKQIELLATFADQAVIAIENARLFDAEQQRTQELAKSLDDLRTAQDRLVQTEKLASLGQLTAGIAHEIKNPLNFVNNFSGLSVELLDELQEAVESGIFDDKRQAEIADLTDTLRGNLDKIAQHGRRADTIVKNMLLHSREGSGEHRAVDINAIVEEALNLAYHGARAEKQGFIITLQRSFDPAAGQVDVFPQDITRVLLNVISNGFYAATKRKEQSDSDGHEPTITAATRSLGDRVQISIRDNGVGISPEVKEKMFNPFFTTKPAGEGTGLGLSLSHDIVVKQHAGAIEVDTNPGEFTEIRIILPRASAHLVIGTN